MAASVTFGKRPLFVDIRGKGVAECEGNIRVKRCAGDICIDVHDGTAWRPAHSYREPSDE